MIRFFLSSRIGGDRNIRLAAFRRSQISSGTEQRNLLLVYKDHVSCGKLKFNEDQFKVLMRLNRLSNYLEKASEREVLEEENSSRSSSNGGTSPVDKPEKDIDKPKSKYYVKGVYIHGGVGVGKTMSMDLFFNNCMIDANRKRRVHLHNFLLEIHARIHKFKQKLLEERGRDVNIDLDPSRDAIAVVASEVAKETRLLAFDEFEVTNVADAMILSKFFAILWQNGTIVVATSNRHPSELYKHGLNRAYFLPFIDQLLNYNIVRCIRGEDYRGQMLSRGESNFISSVELWEKFKMLGNDSTCGSGGMSRNMIVPIRNSSTRTLCVPYSFASNIAWFSFSDLCEYGERGASDFQALVDTFSTVCISDIPKLSVLKHNEARRFVILVDMMYDSQIRVLWSSQFDVADLFLDLSLGDEVEKQDGGPESQWITQSFETPTVPSSKRSAEMLERSFKLQSMSSKITRRSSSDSCIYNNVHLDAGEEDLRVLEGEVASVKELLFAFKRAASRLNEMRGFQYLNAWHIRNDRVTIK